MRRIAMGLTLPLATASMAILGTSFNANADVAPVGAVGDAYVSQTARTANSGAESKLLLSNKTGAKAVSLLKFRVPTPGPNETVTGVNLTLRPQTTTGQTINVYGVSNSWTEASVSWSNSPARGAKLGASNNLVAGTDELIRLPLNSFTPGSVVSVRLETSGNATVRLASSEASSSSARPRLTLTSRTVTSPPTCETDPSLCPPPPTCETDPSLCPQPPTATWPPAGPYAQHIIGMSAPANLWDQRVSEVGANNLNARRIFADLTSTGTSQLPLIREAIADGMVPVVSYKVPDVNKLIAGDYDVWLANLRAQLTALNADLTVTFWHEPHGDMTPEQFRAGSLRFFNAVDADRIAVGPILNGWLLDRRVSDFASYTDTTLLTKWEFVGVDSYQEGTASSPSSTLLPARAVPKLATWLDSQGFPNKPIVLGEYNGFTGAAIQQAGEYILGTPELWIANVWNADHTTFSVLTGARLSAFIATKADPRVVN